MSAIVDTVPEECIGFRLIIFLEQTFLVLCHWKFVSVVHDRKTKFVKESVPRREFHESYENFPATLKRKFAGSDSLEDLKIKIFCEFEVAKCFKGGEIFLSNALNWTKILQFLTTNPKNTEAVNKLECGKCKKRAVVTL